MAKNTNIDLERRQRGLEAIKLQEVEDNPFTPDEIEMFERFEQEGWSEKRCRKYIFQQLGVRSKANLTA